MKNNLTLIKNKSILLNVLRPIGQAVKTPPSHGGIMGSIPVWVTNVEKSVLQVIWSTDFLLL